VVVVAEQEKKQKEQEQRSDTESLVEIADEQHEAIRESLEDAEKRHHETKSEREALIEASELAKEADKGHKNQHDTNPAEKRRGAPSKKLLGESFKTQMNGVRTEMSTSSGLFSKLIHNRSVEKVSDAIGTTIARPNAMLSGSIAAFIGITVLYFTAHYYGYRLSGFETIAAFAIGWLFGILFDYFRVMIRGRKS
jgi:hypothetical protein